MIFAGWNANHYGVKVILDGITAELTADPRRRYIQVEVAFFSIWWEDPNTTDATRAAWRRLPIAPRLPHVWGSPGRQRDALPTPFPPKGGNEDLPPSLGGGIVRGPLPLPRTCSVPDRPPLAGDPSPSACKLLALATSRARSAYARTAVADQRKELACPIAMDWRPAAPARLTPERPLLSNPKQWGCVQGPSAPLHTPPPTRMPKARE